MGEISTINNPLDQTATLRPTTAQRKQPTATYSPSKDIPTQVPEDASQLTKLSSVLNGLKRGATAMREQVSQAMTAVKSGTYQVDPLAVSRSIVLESLARR